MRARCAHDCFGATLLRSVLRGALGIRDTYMRPLQIQILRSGYVVGKKQLRTVVALEAELTRLETKEARLQPAKDVSYRKVAAAMRVLQRRGVFIGLVGNVQC
jgi:biopolymer transport protein ExbD